MRAGLCEGDEVVKVHIVTAVVVRAVDFSCFRAVIATLAAQIFMHTLSDAL